MINVICTILLINAVGSFKDDVEGHIIAEDDTNFVVDFSQATKGYRGDYSRKIVRRSECVRVRPPYPNNK